MALTTSEVGVAVTGELYCGPTGTTAPTDTSTALNAAFKGLGYFDEDGVTESFERDTDDITAWQSATTVRTAVTSAKVTYQGKLIQTNKDVIEAALGATVTQSVPHGTYTINPGSTGGRKSWVFQVVDGSAIKRIYIAEGEVTELGETNYQTGEAIGYDITVTAYTNPVVYDTRLKS